MVRQARAETRTAIQQGRQIRKDKNQRQIQQKTGEVQETANKDPKTLGKNKEYAEKGWHDAHKVRQRTGEQRREHTDLNTPGRAGQQETGETNEGNQQRWEKAGSVKQKHGTKQEINQPKPKR